MFDIRTGWSGLAEEVGSNLHGVPASSGANLGEIYFNDPNNGPYAQFSKGATPAPNPAGTNPYSFTVDIYTDSRIAPSLGVGGGGAAKGSNGIPDFWWTSAVDDAVNGGGYLTESGFTGEVLQGSTGNRTWRFTTTAGGNPGFNAAVNTWYTLEVRWKKDSGGNLVAEHDIYNKAHTSRLYSYTIPAAKIYQGPFSFSRLGGPSYSWFVYPDANVLSNHLSIDNWGVGGPVALVDRTPPTADVVNVTPDPRTTAVSSITINFSEAVKGVDRSDLTLSRSGTGIALTTAQSLTSSNGGRTWVLGGLSGLTTTNGTYTLTLRGAGSGITDLSNNALGTGASDSWSKTAALTANRLASSSISGSSLASHRLADDLFASQPITA